MKDLDDKKLCGERVKLEMSKVISSWSRININSKFLFRFQFREKILNLTLFRDAKTNTEISNVLVESDIEALAARFRHPVDTDRAHETAAIQEVDHAVAVHVAAEMM